MSFARLFTKPRLAGILISVIWIGMSLGWSWFLIASSFDRTISSSLADHTEKVGRDLLPKLAAPSNTDDAVHAEIREQIRTNPGMAYLMVWQGGAIVYHSDPEQERDQVNIESWPTLQPDEVLRISKIKSLPWNSSSGPVVDITLPVQIRPNVAYFLSAGYKQSWIDGKFWATQRPQLLLAGVLTLIGLVGLLAAIGIAGQSMERTRAQQAQGVLARTSLLTERGMLASVLAHEVRSPLTALRFNLHALRTLIASHSSKTQRQLELSDSCDREIRRLDLMLNDFLTRTQVISPAERTHVNRVTKEAIEFLRPSLEQKSIRIITHLDASDPSVIINPAELRQVLLNLCTNAQEAMLRGGTLAVSTLSEQENVSLLVRDSGVGIPPDLQQRIFEPFFSTKPHGSGLGLALVRRVISGAGGKVFCESTMGEGTTFRIVLPRGDASVAPGVTAHLGTDNPEGQAVPQDANPAAEQRAEPAANLLEEDAVRNAPQATES